MPHTKNNRPKRQSRFVMLMTALTKMERVKNFIILAENNLLHLEYMIRI